MADVQIKYASKRSDFHEGITHVGSDSWSDMTRSQKILALQDMAQNFAGVFKTIPSWGRCDLRSCDSHADPHPLPHNTRLNFILADGRAVAFCARCFIIQHDYRESHDGEVCPDLEGDLLGPPAS